MDSRVRYQFTKDRAQRLIKLVLPLYLEMFHQLKAQRGGDLVWPAFVVDQKKNLKANNYVDLYDDDKRFQGAIKSAVFSNEQIQEINNEAENEGHAKVFARLDESFDEFLIDAHKYLKKLREDPNFDDESDENLSTEQNQYLFVSSLATYHNVFSIMVYGKRLAKLVQEAISGNDQSFLQAIKVDHNLIYDHPYFRNRLAKANQDQEVVFLKRAHEQQLAPSLSGRVKHKGLYTMFYFLDNIQMLDKFTCKELFYLYDDCDLKDYETPPYDLSSFSEHLRKYKKNR